MKRFCGAFAAVAFVLAGFPQVRAAPPTVTPSPGYDARLQEQRAATAPAAPVDPFADSLARPVDRRQHARRSHHAPAAPLSKKSNGR